jgi:release factor glutamine methyltransferase
MLVEWSLALVPSPSLVLDVGTGSGCIACAVAAERPAARVIAVDASPAAALVARANALRLGLGERVRVVATDLLTALRHAGADLIVANLPYVPTPALDALSPEVRDHEPRAAVDGGPDGLREIRRLVASAAAALTRDGVLVLETLGGTQTPVVAALMRTAGFTEVTTRADLTGVERFVAGRWS